MEIATNLRPSFIDGAEPRRRIERDARAVAPLLHAPHTVVLDHELLWHPIHERIEFDDQMTTFAAPSAGGKIVKSERHSKPTVPTRTERAA